MNRSILKELLAPFLAALFGATLGSVSAIGLSKYEKSLSQENLKVALAAEIQSIFLAIRMHTLRVSWSWTGDGELLKYHQFYYPRAVFDGNIGQFGALRDPSLVRRITELYSLLELAREEGRRLDSGVADSDGAVRYATFLFGAHLSSVRLIQDLTGDMPRAFPAQRDDGDDKVVNGAMLEREMKTILKAQKAVTQAMIRGDRRPGLKRK